MTNSKQIQNSKFQAVTLIVFNVMSAILFGSWFLALGAFSTYALEVNCDAMQQNSNVWNFYKCDQHLETPRFTFSCYSIDPGDLRESCLLDEASQQRGSEGQTVDDLGQIENPLVGKYRGPGGISNLLNNVVTLIFIVAGILVFFFLLFGGIKWIISGGDQKKTEEARNMITAAVVGLAIVALAWAIVKVLEQFFGLPLTSGAIPTP